MARMLLSGLVLSLVLAVPAQALAQEKAPKRVVEGSAGLKLLAGGNLWTTPDNITPPGYDAIGFAGSAGGFGWGAGLYGEARFIQHLGLELDIGYDSSTLFRNVTYNNVVKINEKVQSSGPRISILAKGIVPTPFGRMWFGLGPEFVIPSSVSASNEITEGRNLIGGPGPTAEQVENAISAKKQSSTMLALAFGLVIHAGEKFEIPIDFRAAKNLSQESDWSDRVKQIGGTSGIDYEVTVQNSWDFRLAVGGGYRF